MMWPAQTRATGRMTTGERVHHCFSAVPSGPPRFVRRGWGQCCFNLLGATVAWPGQERKRQIQEKTEAKAGV